ncbi:hypothetical protein [Flavobacterium beibuense]|uniref:Outer membrane protein beta-barrel domain-containing protein n=1 Tax=Flavobacterium beibuense TaxID=657326 RepID=A0A444WF75_9FLAO|nr:hypothetical protein [Flavobacterium beibuense]RYJ44442.1 hypothetical protein NU09_1052 [Flavobacterium beibuense]
MKKQLLFILSLITAGAFAQDVTIKSLSTKGIIGVTEPDAVVKVDGDLDGIPEDEGMADSNGNFIVTFAIQKSSGAKLWVWSEIQKTKRLSKDTKLERGDVVSVTIGTDFTATFQAEDLSNKTKFYKATILTTNFNIPVARFDFLTKSAQDDSKGNITLFNSVGAGLGLNFGEKKVIYDDQGNVTEQDFSNVVGLHLGVLFSAGTGEDTNNVFAPVLNLTILDFQIGVGWELGDVATNMSGTFMTVSYAIPLYKLSRTGFFTLSEKERKSSGKRNEDPGARSKFADN